MSKQPEALRLAEWLQSSADDPTWSDHTELPKAVAANAAAELRRLHAVNEELLEALQILLRNQDPEQYVERESAIRIARAAIAKAGEQA